MIKREKKIIILIVVLALLTVPNGLAGAASALPDQQAQSSIARALKYLHDAQNTDGGFPAKPGGVSSSALTSWVIMALTAAGENPNSGAWKNDNLTPLDYLRNCAESPQSTCDYARTLLALKAAQQGTVYHGEDLAEIISSAQQPGGQFSVLAQEEQGFINAHIWSIIALHAVQHEIPHKEKAREWLLSQQNADGGFGWYEGLSSDADDTAVALQALVILGEDPLSSQAIKEAEDYIKSCQEQDGGFHSGDLAGEKSNASTDAWVIQGLLGCGEEPQGESWSVNGKNAVSHLLSLQSETGSFNWMAGISSSPVNCTANAIMALNGKTFAATRDISARPANTGTGGSFTDLSAQHWAYTAITELVQAQVITGYSDGTFQPDRAVTRAEYTQMLVSGLGLKESVSPEPIAFVDVPDDYWAYKPIQLAATRAYVSGMPGAVFEPERAIAGAELATMLVKTWPDSAPAAPVNGSLWYTAYVERAEKMALLYPGFKTESVVTRAQCAYSIAALRKVRLTSGVER